VAKPLKTIGLVAKYGAAQPAALAKRIVAWIERRGARVLLEAKTAKALGRDDGVDREGILAKSDLVIVLGGDGTLLGVARLAGRREVPILGVNLGGLGFLAAVPPEQVFQALERVWKGDYLISKRAKLDIHVTRAGKNEARFHALNDIVINKGALARMIEIAAWVDGEPLFDFRADGLIVSTPTGSTAYSLSAGGPVIEPGVGVLVMSPICPHTLTLRPVVLSDRARIEIEVEASHKDILLTVDGQEGIPLLPGDRVHVQRARAAAALVRFSPRTHFEALRSKFNWGAR